MAAEDQDTAVKKWAKKMFAFWPPPVATVEDRIRAGETLGQAVLHHLSDTFGAVAERSKKWSGEDSNNAEYNIHRVVMPVARVAAQNETDIIALKKQVAELQAQLKPPAV